VVRKVGSTIDTIRVGSEVNGLLLPDLVVTVARTDQGVGQFVQDDVPHRGVVVEFHERRRQHDDLLAVLADAEGAAGLPAEDELPAL
jgi:hypothetical protein